MKLTIEGTQEEIKNTLQAISGSKERELEILSSLAKDKNTDSRTKLDVLKRIGNFYNTNHFLN